MLFGRRNIATTNMCCALYFLHTVYNETSELEAMDKTYQNQNQNVNV